MASRLIKENIMDLREALIGTDERTGLHRLKLTDPQAHDRIVRAFDALSILVEELAGAVDELSKK